MQPSRTVPENRASENENALSHRSGKDKNNDKDEGNKQLPARELRATLGVSDITNSGSSSTSTSTATNSATATSAKPKGTKKSSAPVSSSDRRDENGRPIEPRQLPSTQAPVHPLTQTQAITQAQPRTQPQPQPQPHPQPQPQPHGSGSRHRHTQVPSSGAISASTCEVEGDFTSPAHALAGSKRPPEDVTFVESEEPEKPEKPGNPAQCETSEKDRLGQGDTGQKRRSVKKPNLGIQPVPQQGVDIQRAPKQSAAHPVSSLVVESITAPSCHGFSLQNTGHTGKHTVSSVCHQEGLSCPDTSRNQQPVQPFQHTKSTTLQPAVHTYSSPNPRRFVSCPTSATPGYISGSGPHFVGTLCLSFSLERIRTVRSTTNLHFVDNIDEPDYADPSFVCEYVGQCMDYAMKKQVVDLVDPTYMDHHGGVVTEGIREVLVEWLCAVIFKFKLTNDTLFLTIYIVDKYLSLCLCTKEDLQLLGMTALLIASKFEEIYAVPIQDLIVVSDNLYTRERVRAMELQVLNTLHYSISTPSPLLFLRRFSKANYSDDVQHTYSKFLVELSLLEYRMLAYTPSQVAAAAVYLTRKHFHNPTWNDTLQFYTGLTEPDIIPVARELRAVAERCSAPHSRSGATARKKYGMFRNRDGRYDHCQEF
ncbi:G2/M-specific cyclinB [Pelomyxa schiedti]|nr:G2/M-specific cyclinB [Pelomyxa schiedti]